MTTTPGTATDGAPTPAARSGPGVRPRRGLGWKGKLMLAVTVFVGVDFVVGRIADRWWPMLDHERVVALERAFRIASPLYHHDLAPNVAATARWGGAVPMFTNSLGFRDAAVRTVPSQSTQRRLLVLGDSFTEGVGVPYEASFVGRIAAALAPDGVEVLNAACCSYSPTIHQRKVRYLLEDRHLRFDEVVLFLDVSDIQDDAVFYDLDAAGNVVERQRGADSAIALEMASRAQVTASPLRSWLKRSSITLRTLDAVKDWLERDSWRSMTTDTGAMLDALVHWPRAAWTVDPGPFEEFGRRGLERSAAMMDALADLLAARGIPLTIAVYPWPSQIVLRDTDSVHVRFWRDWAQRRSARFLDLFPAFLAGEPRDVLDRYYLRWDCHWNAAGHELVAARFLEFWRP